MSQYETQELAPTEALFGPRSRLTRFARELRVPIGTIFSWKKKRSIPPWRRAAVLDAARRLDLSLAPDVLVYLTQAD